MSFYFYHNWERVPHIKIHKGDCGECKDGKGKQPAKVSGLNSVWSGKFDTKQLAVAYITNYINQNLPIEYCTKCNP